MSKILIIAVLKVSLRQTVHILNTCSIESKPALKQNVNFVIAVIDSKQAFVIAVIESKQAFVIPLLIQYTKEASCTKRLRCYRGKYR